MFPMYLILTVVAGVLVLRYCRSPRPSPRARGVVGGGFVAALLLPGLGTWGTFAVVGFAVYAHLALLVQADDDRTSPPLGR